MSFVTKLDKYKGKAIAVRGTENTWVYNYVINQQFSILGVKFWANIYAHTFHFPRHSNSPRNDGLDAQVTIQKLRAVENMALAA